MSFAELDIPREHINTVIYLDEMADKLGQSVSIDWDVPDKEIAADLIKLASKIEKYGENSAYPVGAVYWGTDIDGRKFILPTVNTIPDRIKDHLPEGEERIGYGENDSHATAHAEMVGINIMPKIKEVSLALRVSPCTTCQEGLSVFSSSHHHSGHINAIYFDDSTLEEPAAKKLWQYSSKMLPEIAKNGKIGLFSIDTDTAEIKKEIAPIHNEGHKDVLIENPVQVQVLLDVKSFDEIDTSEILLMTKRAAKKSTIPNNKEATTLITEVDGKFIAITAAAALPPGFKASESKQHFEHDENTKKRTYKYVMDALKRCKMTAKALGLNTQNSMAVCTRTPTSGMLINAVLYGVDKLVTKSEYKLEHMFNNNPDADKDTTLLALTIGNNDTPPIIKHLHATQNDSAQKKIHKPELIRKNREHEPHN